MLSTKLLLLFFNFYCIFKIILNSEKFSYRIFLCLYKYLHRIMWIYESVLFNNNVPYIT